MNDTDILQSFFLIFGGAAVIATTALYLRQPMLVAYIALGALAGPFGLALWMTQRFPFWYRRDRHHFSVFSRRIRSAHTC